MSINCLEVALVVTTCQQTAVYLGVQGLNATVANLGETRYIADVDNLYAAVGQKFHCAACGNNLPAQGAQLLCKLHNAGLVADAN